MCLAHAPAISPTHSFVHERAPTSPGNARMHLLNDGSPVGTLGFRQLFGDVILHVP